MSTRLKLLQAFDGSRGQVLSGETLARRLGVSRTAIWKQIQSIKNDGLPIESTGRQGYRFNAPFDSSLANFKAPAGVTPHYFVQTVSTQSLAKSGAASGLGEGHLWLAEIQAKGRGRLDRHWESSYGGLWFSLLLRPKMPPARVPPLTLLAGVALCQTVKELAEVEVKLKWPNDLLLRRGNGWRKIAGILTEMAGQTDRTEWVVIGVGLNVNNTISKELSGLASSLVEATGKAGSRGEFLTRFLKHFQSQYNRYQKVGFEPFRKMYWSHYFNPGKSVSLATASGKVTGVARGVDASGAIMIESATRQADARSVASRRKTLFISEGEITL